MSLDGETKSKTGVFLSPRMILPAGNPRSRDGNLLNSSEEKALSQIGVFQTYSDAEMPIFSQGEEAEFLYIVQTGIVRISRATSVGSRQVLGFRWAGDPIGLTADGCYLNSAHTLTAVTAWRFPVAGLRRLMSRQPQIQTQFLAKALDALAEEQNQIVWLGQQDVVRRLATLLVEFSQNRSCYDEEGQTLTLPVGRTDVADYLATSTESVARAFRKLEQKHLIGRSSPRKMVISNLEGLRHFASSGDL